MTHVGGWTCRCPDCLERRRRNRRRAMIKSRLTEHPEGLTRYRLTLGFYRDDALAFWQDAKALGLISVGTSPRGAKLFALPREKTE